MALCTLFCSRKKLNKSANALALCHPPSACFCSVLADNGAPAFSYMLDITF